MTKRLWLISLAALGAASLLILSAVPAVLGNPGLQDATAQQQTIDAVISERFTQTAAAGPQATETPPPQGPTLTAAFEQTVDAAFSQALTATAEANTIHDAAGRDLEPIAPDTVKRLIEITSLANSSPVTHLVFAPDSASLFTASEDYMIRQWDAASGAEIRQFAGHTDTITDLAIAPDGVLLASASQDQTIRVWDVASGTQAQSINAGGDSATSLAFYSSGVRLLSGHSSGLVKFWEVPQGTLIRQFEGYTDTVTDVVFRPPDYRFFASADVNGVVRLRDVTSGGNARTLSEADSPLTSLAYRPDGDIAAVVGRGIAPTLLRIDSTRRLGAARHYSAITFNPTGQLVAAASPVLSDVRIWGVGGGNRLVFRGLEAPALDVAFSNNGVLMATGGTTVRLWGIVRGVGPTETPLPSPTDTATPLPIETQMALDAAATQQAATVQAATQAMLITPTERPLGFPTDVVSEVQIVEQVYERGRMFWIRHNQQIWVMELDVSGIPGGDWYCYNDTFVEGEMEFDPSIIPPEGLIQPHRGFGKLWREHPDLREALGWATTPEFELVSNYSYLAGGYMDSNGAHVPGPGEHRLTTLNGEGLSFFEQTIRGDCVGGRWHVTR